MDGKPLPHSRDELRLRVDALASVREEARWRRLLLVNCPASNASCDNTSRGASGLAPMLVGPKI
jgi:hypothetical protein